MKTTTPRSETTGNRIEARLPEIIDWHFDPRWGSRYWLEREHELGLDARREVATLDALDLFGLMDGDALSRRSVFDFVPRRLLETIRAQLVVADTGGTTGAPSRAVFSGADFHAAFVAPFHAVTRELIPVEEGVSWLWIGPNGPHVVGKAARECCRALCSPDPFAVDFDPRWYKAQAPGSLGRRRYLRHVVDQALDVLRREDVRVLFGTPPVLVEIGRLLEASTRERVSCVHLGGLAADRSTATELLELFPRSEVFSGYGNSLLGMSPQLESRALESPRYFPHGARLHIRLVRDVVEDDAIHTVPLGERGRVLATRLDPSFLIINILERDTARGITPPLEAAPHGFESMGLEDPRPIMSVPAERVGIY